MAPSADTAKVPSTSTFSFKAPFPSSSSSTTTTTTTTFAVPAPIKQRRVSLALPSGSSPRAAWDFRDDTGLDSHTHAPYGSLSVMDDGSKDKDSVPTKRGKIRKLANAGGVGASVAVVLDIDGGHEKKQRKKWSDEETQMLVAGCNKHGVGNWKTILSDPTLHFDNRSPVDLKDRFRTYFPDAYKEHYPNARTHLSSKVRSTLPDGSSLFEKTRSKKRRPFTEEEDRALRAGYEKHGTVWAAIVKDPVFREQGRRSTDLRDRFRNAFPMLYQAAGYKPRNSGGTTAAAKKRMGSVMPGDEGGVDAGFDAGTVPGIGKTQTRAATDDQLLTSSTGPVRTRRRAHTSSGGPLFRGGTKSVPQSTACSEDEDDTNTSEEDPDDALFKAPRTRNKTRAQTKAKALAQQTQTQQPVFVDNVSTGPAASVVTRAGAKKLELDGLREFSLHQQHSFASTDDDDMDMVTFDQLPNDSLGVSEFLPHNHTHSHTTQTTANTTSTANTSSNTNVNVNSKSNATDSWASASTSGLNTPTHSHHTWSTAAASPTSSADFLMGGPTSPLGHAHTHGQGHGMQRGMIGNSAWGTQDWFSPNPRLDSPSSNHDSGTGNGNGNGNADTSPNTPSSSFADLGPFPSSLSLPHSNPLSPASPFSQSHSQSQSPFSHHHSFSHSHSFSSHFPHTLSLSSHHLSHAHLTSSHPHHHSQHAFAHAHAQAQAHGVLDRYDLLGGGLGSTSNMGFGTGDPMWDSHDERDRDRDLDHDFGTTSEMGFGDTHSTFSDELFPPPGGFRGFTHHSSYAGDLIFGARSHQPVYASGGYGGYGGLGLSGMGSGGGLGGVGMAGIEEIGLTGISLDDEVDGVEGAGDSGQPAATDVKMGDETVSSQSKASQAQSELLPTQQKGQAPTTLPGERRDDSLGGISKNEGSSASQPSDSTMPMMEKFSLDDLVDLSAHDIDGDLDIGLDLDLNLDGELSGADPTNATGKANVGGEGNLDLDLQGQHMTPPGTPHISTSTRPQLHSFHQSHTAPHHHHGQHQPPPPQQQQQQQRTSRGTMAGVRRASESTFGGFHGSGSLRSVSVPPSDARVPVPLGLGHGDDEDEEHNVRDWSAFASATTSPQTQKPMFRATAGKTRSVLSSPMAPPPVPLPATIQSASGPVASSSRGSGSIHAHMSVPTTPQPHSRQLSPLLHTRPAHTHTHTQAHTHMQPIPLSSQSQPQSPHIQYVQSQSPQTPQPQTVSLTSDHLTSASASSPQLPPPVVGTPAPTYLLSPDPYYTWRPMSPAEMSNLSLSFLDLHYYNGSADAEMDGSGAGAETHGQIALDLAGSGHGVGMGSGMAIGMGMGMGTGVGARAAIAENGLVLGGVGIGGGHVMRGETGAGTMRGIRHTFSPNASNGSNGKLGSSAAVRTSGGGGMAVGEAAFKSVSGVARSQSHHRGQSQSVVCPQDLMLRSDNKRKRASWDGAHG
ncbi:hypothetical protein H0H92_007836 [Tricholoma furcatifolium]|nr:hypothetical protein H0H92_007836 [Tricholoma furcatifolium]